MKKYLLIICAIAITIALVCVAVKFSKKETSGTIIDSEFQLYDIPAGAHLLSNSNVAFQRDPDEPDSINLLTLGAGESYNFDLLGSRKLVVNDINDKYITVTIEGMAPQKKSGGINLTKKYEKITIPAQKGIKFTVQATDIFDGSIILYYVK